MYITQYSFPASSLFEFRYSVSVNAYCFNNSNSYICYIKDWTNAVASWDPNTSALNKKYNFASR